MAQTHPLVNMHLVSLVFLSYFLYQEEPRIEKITDSDFVEVFNSIDKFKQYHTSTFKVNLFRRKDNQASTEGLVSNYVIAILNYSDTSSPLLYEVKGFLNAQVVEVIRQKGALKMTIEHGTYDEKKRSMLMLTREGAEIHAM